MTRFCSILRTYLRRAVWRFCIYCRKFSRTLLDLSPPIAIFEVDGLVWPILRSGRSSDPSIFSCGRCGRHGGPKDSLRRSLLGFGTHWARRGYIGDGSRIRHIAVCGPRGYHRHRRGAHLQTHVFLETFTPIGDSQGQTPNNGVVGRSPTLQFKRSCGPDNSLYIRRSEVCADDRRRGVGVVQHVRALPASSS